MKVDAACAGAGLFLSANYANIDAGFSALGAKGKPAEMVAEEAVAAFLAYDRRQGALDQHLADQLLLPLSLADKPSCFTTERRTLHLETNAWVIEAFGQAEVRIESTSAGATLITVEPGSSVARQTRPVLEAHVQRSEETASWNAIVTVHDREWRTARRLLSRLGSVAPTDFHNVLVMQVEDPERLIEQLALWVEREPGLLNTLAHVFVAQVNFSFDDEDAFESQARDALAERLGELAGRSFYLRVYRRGFKGRHSSHDLERRFGAFVLETLEAAGQFGDVDFVDPDVVVLIETVGRRAGIWFCSRQDRRRLPFRR